MADDDQDLLRCLHLVDSRISDPQSDAQFLTSLSNYKTPETRTPDEQNYIVFSLFLRKLLLKAKGNPPRVVPTGPEPAPVEPPQPH